MNRPELWRLEGVTLDRRVRDVTLTVEPGVTAVLGPSGAGKTSLLNLLVRFETPDRGTIAAGFDRGQRTRALYWVPQGDGLWPHLTARGHLAAMGTTRGDALLDAFDLGGRADALPRVLSQGERARLAVARALAADAAVLVMDEPLAHVDPARIGGYWAVVRRHLAETGASLVFATHVPETVLGEARQVVAMQAGLVCYAGAVHDLYRTPATADLAACLGDANWMEPADAQMWLHRDAAAARCYRPEQVRAIEDGNGPLVVEAVRFKGSVTELQLRHVATGRARAFLVRVADDALAAGARIRLLGI